MKRISFIVKLFPHDYITLSIILWSAMALWLSCEGHYALAIATLFVSLFADAIDGVIARRLERERPFGRHLDGFMDMLSYLIVPSIMLYQLGFQGVFTLFLLIFIASGVIRLSVFNIEGNYQTNCSICYQGVPVFWSLFVLCAFYFISLSGFSYRNELFAGVLSLYSFAMLWRRPFFKFTDITHIVIITLYGTLFFLWLHIVKTVLGEEVLTPYWQALLLYLPIVFSGSLHMLVVRRNWLSKTAKPINSALLGENKTWRGFIVMPIVGGLSAAVIALISEHLVESSTIEALPVDYIVAGVALSLCRSSI